MGWVVWQARVRIQPFTLLRSTISVLCAEDRGPAYECYYNYPFDVDSLCREVLLPIRITGSSARRSPFWVFSQILSISRRYDIWRCAGRGGLLIPSHRLPLLELRVFLHSRLDECLMWVVGRDAQCLGSETEVRGRYKRKYTWLESSPQPEIAAQG